MSPSRRQVVASLVRTLVLFEMQQITKLHPVCYYMVCIRILCIFQHPGGQFMWQGFALPGPSGWISRLKSRTMGQIWGKGYQPTESPESQRLAKRNTSKQSTSTLQPKFSFSCRLGKFSSGLRTHRSALLQRLLASSLFIYCLRSSIQSHPTCVLHSSLRSEVSDRNFK